MSAAAKIIEVFSSIQGEGIYVGNRHLFVRFWNCNLSCHYCDTDYRGPFREYSDQELLREVRTRIEEEGPHQAVSLTGGEPLLWWQFLQGWLPLLKGLGQSTYLETNGTLPEPLEKVLPWIDTIAMDLKPPTATADRAVWKEHGDFLRVATSGHNGDGSGTVPNPEVFVKVVVTRETSSNELEQSFDLVASVDPQIPVVLQPVTPWGPVKEPPTPEQMEQWRRLARRSLSDVRVIPQVHRILGVP